MSTDAPDVTKTADAPKVAEAPQAAEAAAPTPTTASVSSWGLETANGSLRPRSALDVLVDLNDKVTTGQVSEYQPVPLGFTPLDKTIGRLNPARGSFQFDSSGLPPPPF